MTGTHETGSCDDHVFLKAYSCNASSLTQKVPHVTHMEWKLPDMPTVKPDFFLPSVVYISFKSYESMHRPFLLIQYSYFLRAPHITECLLKVQVDGVYLHHLVHMHKELQQRCKIWVSLTEVWWLFVNILHFFPYMLSQVCSGTMYCLHCLIWYTVFTNLIARDY